MKFILIYSFLVAQIVKKKKKNPPAMQKTLGSTLGQEDALEKGMATHSNILAWRIPWTEEPDGLQSTGLQRVRHNSATNTFTFIPIPTQVCITLKWYGKGEWRQTGFFLKSMYLSLRSTVFFPFFHFLLPRVFHQNYF